MVRREGWGFESCEVIAAYAEAASGLILDPP
jgi:hypothetical protein